MPPTTIDLHVSDADRILAHLLRLSAEDRSMRFSAGLVTDDTIRQYAARIRFGHDLVMGQVSKLGQLIGLAHGCVFEHGGQTHIEATFSVDAQWRGIGLGTALMAALQAASSDLAFPADRERVAMVGICAPRNWPMRRIFQGAGLALHREDDDMHAHGWMRRRKGADGLIAAPYAP